MCVLGFWFVKNKKSKIYRVTYARWELNEDFHLFKSREFEDICLGPILAWRGPVDTPRTTIEKKWRKRQSVKSLKVNKILQFIIQSKGLSCIMQYRHKQYVCSTLAQICRYRYRNTSCLNFPRCPRINILSVDERR